MTTVSPRLIALVGISITKPMLFKLEDNPLRQNNSENCGGEMESRWSHCGFHFLRQDIMWHGKRLHVEYEEVHRKLKCNKKS